VPPFFEKLPVVLLMEPPKKADILIGKFFFWRIQMIYEKNQFELGLDGSLRPAEEKCLPLLRDTLRVRRASAASLLRVR